MEKIYLVVWLVRGITAAAATKAHGGYTGWGRGAVSSAADLQFFIVRISIFNSFSHNVNCTYSTVYAFFILFLLFIFLSLFSILQIFFRIYVFFRYLFFWRRVACIEPSFGATVRGARLCGMSLSLAALPYASNPSQPSAPHNLNRPHAVWTVSI